MIENTKNEIFFYVKKISRSLGQEQITSFSTTSISSKLNLSRNLTSQYLNQLHKEKKLIKISTRPVYFFDYEVLMETYHFDSLEFEYISIDELLSNLNKAKEKNTDFNRTIGKDDSLSYCIEQSITATTYPTSALPIFIIGESGSGKTFFSSIISEYALNKKIVENKSYIFHINCMKYQNDAATFIKLITKIIEQSIDKKKIITFDDIHFLNNEAIEKILTILEMKDLDKHSHQFIITCSNKFDDTTRQKITSRIPIIIKLPPLNERLLNEKERFIHHFFTEEEHKIDKSISISNHVFNLLIYFDFFDNINGLRNAIQLSVANAYAKLNNKESDELNIYVHDLPDSLISNQSNDKYLNENANMIKINKRIDYVHPNEMIEFFEFLLKHYESFSNYNISYNDFFSQCFRKISDYYDYLMFDNKYSNSRVKAIEKITDSIIKNIEDTYRLYFPATFQYAIASSIFNRLQMHSKIVCFEEKHLQLIQSFYQTIRETFSKEAIITDEIANLIFQKLDIKIDDMDWIIITLSIHVYNHNIQNTETLGLVIAHGYSSASSIADTTNSLLGYHLFESIDMPLTMQMLEVSEKIKKLMSIKRNVKNLILMVDMGSLENLGESLDSLYNVNIGIVNNISTGLAINIGYKILANMTLKQIMTEACNEHLIQYKIIINTKRDKALLFTSENGNVINEKLVDLFKKSLPKKTGIHIVPYDYKTLLKEGNQSFIFDTYEILFICGTMNPNISSVPFIGLDSFMNITELSKIASTLYPYLNKTELQQFQENLLLNFSQQNIVGYLTILDAKNVIKTVNKSLSTLKKNLEINIDFNTSIGLIIHVSCMIERLVTHTAIDELIDLSNMSSTDKLYTDIIQESLKNIAFTYGVEIPISEIIYIYDYINEFLNSAELGK